MEFYRYEAVQYASMSIDGEYESSKIINPKIELRVYNLWKETPKGYWIGYGMPDTLNGGSKWVSKTSRKRFAYPTKKEAMTNFITRNERRVKILLSQLDFCRFSLNNAKRIKL